MWIYRENDTSMASVENSSLELADPLCQAVVRHPPLSNHWLPEGGDGDDFPI
jgi:hypothetical protein